MKTSTRIAFLVAFIATATVRADDPITVTLVPSTQAISVRDPLILKVTATNTSAADVQYTDTFEASYGTIYFEARRPGQAQYTILATRWQSSLGFGRLQTLAPRAHVTGFEVLFDRDGPIFLSPGVYLLRAAVNLRGKSPCTVRSATIEITVADRPAAELHAMIRNWRVLTSVFNESSYLYINDGPSGNVPRDLNIPGEAQRQLTWVFAAQDAVLADRATADQKLAEFETVLKALDPASAGFARSALASKLCNVRRWKQATKVAATLDPATPARRFVEHMLRTERDLDEMPATRPTTSTSPGGAQPQASPP